MPLRRNIESRGRLWRFLIGLGFAGAALACALALPGVLRWAAAAPGAVAAFMIFEAAAGWCAARACGLRTPF